MSKHKAPKNSLFLRIVLQLTLPLILLVTLLTALQVNMQLASLNRILQVESQWTFTAFEKKIQSQFKSVKNEQDVIKLDESFKKRLQNFNVSEISLFNYLKGSPVNPKDNWDPFDLEHSEKVITESGKNGKPYRIALNRQTHQLLVYVPLTQPGSDSIYIARAAILLPDFKEAINKSRTYLIVMLVLVIIVGSMMGYNMSRSIIRPIRLLNRATQEITRGKLGSHVKIQTGDEIEILANTFNEMSESLQEMQKKAVDANPLTGLPGNQGIFTELKSRIFERQKFVLFHADLDRFKVYNDHYGLAKGDEAIKFTAELLKKALLEKGAQDDYVGHQGGDDFVIITRPQKAQNLAQYVIEHFGTEVVQCVYSKEDLARGFTVHEDRRYYTETGIKKTTEFPLLAISLAGVSTAKKDLADYFQCMTLATEIKHEAKKNVKSSFIIKEDF